MKTTIQIEVEVDYNYNAGCRGAREKWGVPLEPDEPASVEITSVTYNGVEIEVDKETIKELEEEAMDEVGERMMAEVDF